MIKIEEKKSHSKPIILPLKAHDGLIHFAQTVMEIVNKNNLAERTFRDDAARTMNCEQIVPGKH